MPHLTGFTAPPPICLLPWGRFYVSATVPGGQADLHIPEPSNLCGKRQSQGPSLSLCHTNRGSPAQPLRSGSAHVQGHAGCEELSLPVPPAGGLGPRLPSQSVPAPGCWIHVPCFLFTFKVVVKYALSKRGPLSSSGVLARQGCRLGPLLLPRNVLLSRAELHRQTDTDSPSAYLRPHGSHQLHTSSKTQAASLSSCDCY